MGPRSLLLLPVLLLAVTRAPSPVAQALIMNQMLRMTQAFYEMHQANKDLRETQLINDAFEQHLAAVAAPLPEGKTPSRRQPTRSRRWTPGRTPSRRPASSRATRC